MNPKRGYVPEDDKNFSPEALEKMRTASRHVCYLINEGYDLKSAVTFAGNHFLLSERQRLAIMRSVAEEARLKERAAREKCLADIGGEDVWADGFNMVITLEVMLSDSVLLLGMDGTIRDLAALRGTYRVIPETAEAVRILLGHLQRAGVRKIHILLDEPVSNSCRLKVLIAEIGEVLCVDLDIQILRDVDRTLYSKENVITSDAIILDHCGSWVNVTEACLRERGVQPYKVWG